MSLRTVMNAIRSAMRRLIELLKEEGVFDAEARRAAAQFPGRLGGLKVGQPERRS